MGSTAPMQRSSAIATSSQASIAIRTCQERDHEGLFALYGSVFGTDAVDRFRRRWRWQFLENPVNHRFSSQMWVADRDGEIVGFLASFPTRMKVGHTEQIIYHDCDLIVSPTARRMGIGEGLVRAYDEFPNPLSNALAYAPANGRIRGRVGYRPLRAVPFYYRPLQPAQVLEFARRSRRVPAPLNTVPLAWFVDAAAYAGDLTVRAGNALREPSVPSDLAVETVSSAGSAFDELWNRLRHKFPLAAVRDRQFVTWRYLNDPVFDHTLTVARTAGGALRGYIATRLGPKDGMTVGRIIDVFCDPDAPAVVDALIAGALRVFQEAGCGAVSCLGLLPKIRHRVQRYLYLRPRRLNRPAWMLWKGDESMRGLVYDENQWHLSQGDSDIGFSP